MGLVCVLWNSRWQCAFQGWYCNPKKEGRIAEEDVCRRFFDDALAAPRWPWAVWHVGRKGSVQTIKIMNFTAVVHSLRHALLHVERRLLQAAGLDRQLGEFTDCYLRELAEANANHGNKLWPLTAYRMTSVADSQLFYYYSISSHIKPELIKK